MREDRRYVSTTFGASRRKPSRLTLYSSASPSHRPQVRRSQRQQSEGRDQRQFESRERRANRQPTTNPNLLRGKRGRAPPSTGHGLSRRKAQNERRILRIFKQRSCVQVDKIFLDRKGSRRGRVFSPCWDEDTSRPLSELLAQAANR